MAFFKKRGADAEELSRLNSEIASMTARLTASEAEKRQLDEQIRGLASNVEQQREQLAAATERSEVAAASQADLDIVRGRLVHLAQRVDANDAASSTSSPPTDALEELREQLLKLDRRIDEQVAIHSETSPGMDAAAIDALRERLDGVDVRLDAVAAMRAIDPSTLHALHERLEDLARRFDVPISAPPSTPPPPPLTDVPSLDDDGAEEPESNSDAPVEVDDLRQQVVAVSDRLDGVDQRLVSISRELAMQIDELGRELDGPNGDDQLVSLLDELRDAQSRLAAEQARYQIAFRSDLADLADRLAPH